MILKSGLVALSLLLAFDTAVPSYAQSRLPTIEHVDAQPLLASVNRLVEAMDYIGSPLSESVVAEIKSLELGDDRQATQRIQQLLDPFCLAGVSINETGPPSVSKGNARRELLEQGWRTFLIKVVNQPRNASRLLIESPNAQPIPHAPAAQVDARWMQL